MKKFFDITIGRPLGDRSGWAIIGYSGQNPDLPVLPATVLQLELKSRGLSVDLSEVVRVLRKDLGAVAHIFRCCEERYSSSTERYSRLEDCVSSLGFRESLRELEGQIRGNVLGSSFTAHTWQHSAEIAERCEAVVGQSELTVSMSDAYMVGLFHELGEICEAMSVDGLPMTKSDPIESAILAAESWGLPEPVLQYLRELQNPSMPQLWTDIVGQAHGLTSEVFLASAQMRTTID